MKLPDKLTAKSLDGVRFRFAETKEVVEDGRKKKAWVPKDRPATLKDIIGFRLIDDKSVSVVLGDGQRLVVPLG